MFVIIAIIIIYIIVLLTCNNIAAIVIIQPITMQSFVFSFTERMVITTTLTRSRP